MKKEFIQSFQSIQLDEFEKKEVFSKIKRPKKKAIFFYQFATSFAVLVLTVAVFSSFSNKPATPKNPGITPMRSQEVITFQNTTYELTQEIVDISYIGSKIGLLENTDSVLDGGNVYEYQGNKICIEKEGQYKIYIRS